MKHSKALALMLFFLLAGASSLWAADPDPLVREMNGEVAPVTRTAAEWQQAAAQSVSQLLAQMGSESLQDQNEAKQTLQALCFHASRPGAEAERAAFSTAIAAQMNTAALEDRLWLLDQLRVISRGEAVDALAKLLTDSNRLLRQRALAALQANPDPSAGAALRAALAATAGAETRIALVNALGARRDTESIPALSKLLANADSAVAESAAAALGRIGGAPAADALTQSRDKATAGLRRVLADALLHCAATLPAADALAIYRQLDNRDEARPVRIAALRGRAQAEGEAALPRILKALQDNDPQVQGTAARLAAELPGKEVAPYCAARLRKLPATAQVSLLAALADRGDAAALPAVLAAARDKNEAVRLAALQAMGQLGDATAVPVLVRAAVSDKGAAADAARESLNTLRGPGADAAILAALPKEKPAARLMLIRTLVTRQARTAAPMLLETAADPDPAMRLEALKALAALATGRELPGLTALLTRAGSDEERQAAEQALVATCRRTANPEERAAAILAALPAAPAAARPALLRVLGCTGSERALEAIRAARQSGDAAAAEAAVQALAVWPDTRVKADLLALVRSTDNEAQRATALRAYVRVLGTATPDAAAVEGYRDALALARGEAEKKLVLEALATAPVLPALKLAVAQLTDTEAAASAAAATIQLADQLRDANREEALAAMRTVVRTTTDEAVRRQAQQMADAITGYADYITDWLVAGPYMAAGKEGTALFDTAFDPENPDATGTRWRREKLRDPANPWELNFARTAMMGDNRVAYLRTQIWSPVRQDAYLALGSDDGIKVWLNGKVCHANNTPRPIKADSDRVRVTLEKGKNTLLLKIVNGSNDWGACARFQTLDGGSLSGLRVQAE